MTGLIGGRVEVTSSAAERTFEWRPRDPAWTRDYPFRTSMRPAPVGGFVIDGRTTGTAGR